ncbi:uncharacterized protein P174DRAFT_430548 [Aspergillus novofumigatus IBT 16806]|uniref:Uncharacterized protein n=1 Tax=Aspergillus novofumigatus (strain IBT 16806) TaxID=1392255 RepID=A0A2I1C7E0_ASPN1|nr:uncharacterized protein P174DRAFT_430548 [Aspergillus novofumigatus IBT 16806]PKX93544.1 hypothetical protein P174DRAFT_430548 [Aspergillus novofumigatus IBT 16806]
MLLIVEDLESGNLRLLKSGGSSESYIRIISNWKEPQILLFAKSPEQDALNLLKDYTTIFWQCHLTAQSSLLNLNFIVLTVLQLTANQEFLMLLADTMAVLLEQGYSVTVRLIIPDYREEKE